MYTISTNLFIILLLICVWKEHVKSSRLRIRSAEIDWCSFSAHGIWYEAIKKHRRVKYPLSSSIGVWERMGMLYKRMLKLLWGEIVPTYTHTQRVVQQNWVVSLRRKLRPRLLKSQEYKSNKKPDSNYSICPKAAIRSKFAKVHIQFYNCLLFLASS